MPLDKSEGGPCAGNRPFLSSPRSRGLGNEMLHQKQTKQEQRKPIFFAIQFMISSGRGKQCSQSRGCGKPRVMNGRGGVRCAPLGFGSGAEFPRGGNHIVDLG